MFPTPSEYFFCGRHADGIRYPLSVRQIVDYENDEVENEDPPPSDFGAASEGEKRAGLGGWLIPL